MAFSKKSSDKSGAEKKGKKEPKDKKVKSDRKSSKKPARKPVRKVVGVEIDSRFIRTVEITDGSKRTFRKFHEEPLDPGVVVNGDVVDAAELTTVLQKIWKEQKYASREVQIAVNTEQSLSVLQVMEDEKDFARTLPFRIPVGTFDPSEYYLGFHNLDFYKEDERDTSRVEGFRTVNKREILLVGLKRDVTDTLVEGFRKAKLFPVALDIGALSIMRANPTTSPSGTMDVYININSDTTLVVVSHLNQPAFLRSINYGDLAITNRIAEEMEISASYARELQDKCGEIKVTDILRADEDEVESVFGSDQDVVKYSEDQIRAYHIVQGEIAEIIESINVTISFFQRNNAMGLGQDIGDIILSGDTVVLEPVRQRIAGESNLDVSLSKPIEALKASGAEFADDTVNKVKQEKFATAVGMTVSTGEVQD